MDPITRQAIAVAAGGAAADDSLYVDDVFSTFLYEGDGGTQAIDNGIDFSGEGGLVWIKRRDSSNGHFLVDTERGRASNLNSSSSSAAGTSSANRDLVSFNNNGFTVGPAEYENLNGSGRDFVSWSFRKAPGFFDVVTYTGNGAAGRTVSHNLGSVPGFIIVKRYSATEDWTCYHRSAGATKYLQLNSTYAEVDDNRAWNDTEPTSSVFTVGTHDRVNTNGQNYVAYVFAHDDQSFGTDSDEAIIKCGSYSGTGSSGNHVNVGFEPQWLLIKNSGTSNTNWTMFDVMRGLPAASGATAVRLDANLTDQENLNNSVEPSPTGFTPTGAGSYTNASGGTYVYMAIRRPHKPPTTGTVVFNPTTYTGNQTSRVVGGSSNLTDLAFLIDRDATSTAYSTYGHYALTRLHGAITLATASSQSQTTGWANYFEFDVNKGLKLGGFSYQNNTGTDYVLHTFTRAPGFFDVVTYTGTGSSQTVNHNLGATPDLLIVKKRNSSGTWWTYSSVTGNNAFMKLEGTDASESSTNLWNNTTPNSTTFSLGSNNNVVASGSTYVAYLFATLSGVSKAGSYTGTGSNINVDCGFSAGARFILIKRTDSSSDWYVWDSARGIVATNDPYILLNNTAAEVNNTNYIEPLNAGFTVRSSAPAALNASGGTYLFLAIA